jgi:Protein of unknown function (DUF3037)
MVSKYSVARYLPNPLSGEMINIGVIAWGDGQIATHFVKDWRRAKAFGREDISFLRDFVEQIEASAQVKHRLLTRGSNPIDAKYLEQIVEAWGNSIQFSELRTSLRSPDEVIREISSIYLPALPHHSQKGRTRRTAALLALHRVTQVLIDERGPQASDLIKREHGIQGKIDAHVFDVVVANGRPLLAAQGLSFEKSFTRTVQKDVDATAWAIDDVRKAHRHLPVAILALSHEESYPPVERARKIFRALEADMVSEKQMDRWAKQKIKTLPVAHLAANAGTENLS